MTFAQQGNEPSTASPYEIKNSLKEDQKTKKIEVRKIDKLPQDSKKFTVLPGTKQEGVKQEEKKDH